MYFFPADPGGGGGDEDFFWPGTKGTLLRRQLICPVTGCNTAVGSNSDFHRHWKERHVASVVMYHCSYCNFPAKRKTNLIRHACVRHGLSKDEAVGKVEFQANKEFINPSPWTLHKALNYVRN